MSGDKPTDLGRERGPSPVYPHPVEVRAGGLIWETDTFGCSIDGEIPDDYHAGSVELYLVDLLEMVKALYSTLDHRLSYERECEHHWSVMDERFAAAKFLRDKNGASYYHDQCACALPKDECVSAMMEQQAAHRRLVEGRKIEDWDGRFHRD